MQPDTTPAPAARPDPVTAFLAADRARAAALFLAFALLWAGPAAYCTYKAVKGWGSSPAKKETAETKEGEPPAEEEKVVPPDPNLSSYVVTAGLAWTGALIALGGALWLRSGTPPTAAAGEWTRVRTAVLGVGVLAGLLLMLAGLWYFVTLFDVLTRWIDRGEAKDAWKVLTALLVFVLGAGLAFAAAQPARAEERNDHRLRQLVYGSNFALTALLLLMLLVAGNVVAGVKLPNKLDTTESGVFSLQPTTETFIRQLDQKVTVYLLIPSAEEGPPYGDIRRLVQAAQDVNPDKFVVRYISTVSPAEAQRLKNKFPQADLEAHGLIVAVGDDESRYAFIRDQELVKREGFGPTAKVYFQGESRLMKELVFLAENRAKPIVYVTQGNGELSLGGFGEDRAGPARSMANLKAYLEKNNIEVRPLTFDLKATKVPDDATVVIVADPRAELPKEVADALGAYLNTPKEGGKKGKLLALLGPHPGPVNREVQPTGLEGVLGAFNVQPRPSFLYCQPTRQTSPDEVIVGVSEAAVTARIPAAMTLRGEVFPVPDCRVVTATRQGGNPAYQATPLLLSVAITWVEPTRPSDPTGVFTDMIKNRNVDLIQKKQASESPRPVAVAVSEGGAGRVVVVGSGRFFSDEYGRRFGEATPAGQLLATSIDWLRERREVPDVVNKPFEFYTLPAEYDGVRMFGMPLLLSVLGLAALGAGVWVVRRK